MRRFLDWFRDRSEPVAAPPESATMLEAILENAYEGVAVFERGRVLMANRKLADMLGVSRDELLASRPLAFVHPDDRAILRASYRRVLDGRGAPLHHEIRVCGGDGATRWLRHHVTLIEREGREATLEFFSDVTAEKQASDALRRSESRTRALYRATPAMMCSLDRRCRVVEVSDLLLEALGTRREEVVGREATALLVDASHDELVRDHLEVLLREQSIRDVPCRVLRHDGSVMEARVSAFAERDQRGRIRQILAVVLDVTEQERLEDYLRQMQKLEALGTLAGGIAHDFNNILFAILGYADMALEGVAEESPARSDLEEIVAAGERAKGLVSQIISFARGGDGSRAPMDPAPIVKEGLKLMRATLPQNVRLQASIDGPGAPILANPTSLHQILMNLCRNATQAVAETGGEVRVRLERTALEADAPSNPPGLAAGPYARLAVTDDGPGISPAAQERIFDPFYTTREPGSGSGMGLAVVHGIVSDLGGAVTLDSRQGGGTTVTVLLPLDVEAEAGDETAETAPHASGVVAGRLRILVVDDEPSLVAMLLGMLESLGHEARGHSDPHEALAEFERAPDAVDLVITDQTMPDMTGEELAQALFARRADLPVIVCTGFSESLSPERAEELGVAGFLMKPFTMKELKRRVAKAAPRDQIPAETIEQGGPPS